MGYAAVVFEAVLSSWLFKREPEREMLAGLAGAIVPFARRLRVAAARTTSRSAASSAALFAFDLLQRADAGRARAGHRRRRSSCSSDARRQRLGSLFRAAMLFMLAGSALPLRHLPGGVPPGRALVLLPQRRRDPDHPRPGRRRDHALHRHRQGRSRSSHWRSDMSRITIDPVTRIEGHLRIDVEVDGGRRAEGVVVGPDVPRHRAHPAGPRSARGLALHPALLRRVHHRARDRLGARGRERAAARGAAQRAVHPQPDPRRARDARSHRPLLPPVGARLGRRRLGAEGRSGEDVARSPRACRRGRATAG